MVVITDFDGQGEISQENIEDITLPAENTTAESTTSPAENEGE